MLNRRILRIKAMQALYSYYLMKQSLMDVCREALSDKYKLDPAIHDFNDKEELEARQASAMRAFQDNVLTGALKSPGDLEASVADDVNKAILDYFSQVDKERDRIKAAMIREAEDISDTYVQMLLLPAEFALIDAQERDKTRPKPPKPDWNYNLADNPLIGLMSEGSKLSSMAASGGITWDREKKLLRSWYKDALSEAEDFQDYQAKSEPSDEDHLGVLLAMYKRVIFKSDLVSSYFAEKDLHWNENQSILKNLVVKTIKGYHIIEKSPLALIELSQNKADDFAFFETLFSETIADDENLEQIIKDKARNWDLSRIAQLDMVILKMALTEMIKFPSIPIKVTINEFI